MELLSLFLSYYNSSPFLCQMLQENRFLILPIADAFFTGSSASVLPPPANLFSTDFVGYWINRA